MQLIIHDKAPFPMDTDILWAKRMPSISTKSQDTTQFSEEIPRCEGSIFFFLIKM